MKVKKNILSLLMIVMLFITAALPVAADTVITTNDGTVLVCDDNGNCQIVGYINNNINTKDHNFVYTSNSDSDGINALPPPWCRNYFFCYGVNYDKNSRTHF